MTPPVPRLPTSDDERWELHREATQEASDVASVGAGVTGDERATEKDAVPRTKAAKPARADAAQASPAAKTAKPADAAQASPAAKTAKPADAAQASPAAKAASLMAPGPVAPPAQRPGSSGSPNVTEGARGPSAPPTPPRRRGRWRWYLLLFLLLLATAGAAAVLGYTNQRFYYLECRPGGWTAARGRAIPPWGTQVLKQARWTAIPDPAGECIPRAVASADELEGVMLEVLVDQIRGHLASGASERVATAEALATQARLLERAPQRKRSESTLASFEAEISFRHAQVRLRDAAREILRTAETLEENAQRHTSDGDHIRAWARVATDAARLLERGPDTADPAAPNPALPDPAEPPGATPAAELSQQPPAARDPVQKTPPAAISPQPTASDGTSPEMTPPRPDAPKRSLARDPGEAPPAPAPVPSAPAKVAPAPASVPDRPASVPDGPAKMTPAPAPPADELTAPATDPGVPGVPDSEPAPPVPSHPPAPSPK